MAGMDDSGLLRAAIAVALADGELRRSEAGFLKKLAERAGVGRVSFEAMLGAAENDPSFADDVLLQSRKSAGRAFELLVAEARIDGVISEKERQVLVRIARGMRIADQEVETLFQAGIRRADAIRRSRGLESQ